MYVQIGSSPTADFDHPLQLLSECHRRVEQFFDVLLKLSRDHHGVSLNESQRQALATALNYFQSAAPRHHEDEELSLFPRMRASGDPQALAALDKLKQLEMEHEQAKPDLQRVQELGRSWLDRGVLDPVQAGELQRRVGWLCNLYRQHIQMEDMVIFPLAGKVLCQEQLARIGREMADRRRLNPGRAQSRCGQRRRALQL